MADRPYRRSPPRAVATAAFAGILWIGDVCAPGPGVAAAESLGRRQLEAPAGHAGSVGTDSAPAVPPHDARAEARRILAQRRFRPARTPRPLRGVLRRVGGWLRPVLEPVGRLWQDVSGNLGSRLVMIVAVIGLAALTAARLVRRRTTAGVAPHGRRRRPAEEDPGDLERRADRAERAGDLDLALRLRFRAGVLRLDRAGLVPYRPSLTTGQLTSAVRSPAFEELARSFDEIAYGGRPAGPPDLQQARAGWPRVFEEARPAEPGGRAGAGAAVRGAASAGSRP